MLITSAILNARKAAAPVDVERFLIARNVEFASG